MVDSGSAYLEVQQRLAALLGSLEAAELATPVPACPAWSVRDLASHHIGVVSDIVVGDLHELGDPMRLLNQWRDVEVARDRDTLTARHVAERRGRSMTALLDEWSSATAQVVPMLSGEVPFPNELSPIVGSVLINDVVVHEGDIRQALSLEVAPDVLATSLALAGYGASLSLRLAQVLLPALEFRYGDKQRRFGEGEPGAIVTADRTTLVRMLASRLDKPAILALDWAGDPADYLPVLGEYGPS